MDPPGRGRRARRPTPTRAARRCSTTSCSRCERAGYPPPLVHAANSAAGPGVARPPAATWCGPASRSTGSRRARRGRAVSPSCEPALSLRARVSHVQRLAAGERRLLRPSHRSSTGTRTIATLPLGLRRRRAPPAVRGRRRGADRRPAPAHRRRRHDGPADGRLRRRPGRRRATRPCCSAARAASGSPPGTGPARLGTIAYEVCAGSAPACPASTRARSRAGLAAGGRERRARTV